VMGYGLAASVWATTIGYPDNEHDTNPLFVMTIGVPTFPAAAFVNPGFNERTVDEHGGTAVAPASDDPVKVDGRESDRKIAVTGAPDVRTIRV
jgi:hypothetical protein